MQEQGLSIPFNADSSSVGISKFGNSSATDTSVTFSQNQIPCATQEELNPNKITMECPYLEKQLFEDMYACDSAEDLPEKSFHRPSISEIPSDETYSKPSLNVCNPQNQCMTNGILTHDARDANRKSEWNENDRTISSHLPASKACCTIGQNASNSESIPENASVTLKLSNNLTSEDTKECQSDPSSEFPDFLKNGQGKDALSNGPMLSRLQLAEKRNEADTSTGEKSSASSSNTVPDEVHLFLYNALKEIVDFTKKDAFPVLWLNKNDISGLLSIPLGSELGLWGCWTNRGLCFLMDISHMPIPAIFPYKATDRVNYLPFVVIGLHRYEGHFFKGLVPCEQTLSRFTITNKSCNASSPSFQPPVTEKEAVKVPEASPLSLGTKIVSPISSSDLLEASFPQDEKKEVSGVKKEAEEKESEACFDSFHSNENISGTAPPKPNTRSRTHAGQTSWPLHNGPESSVDTGLMSAAPLISKQDAARNKKKWHPRGQGLIYSKWKSVSLLHDEEIRYLSFLVSPSYTQRHLFTTVTDIALSIKTRISRYRPPKKIRKSMKTWNSGPTSGPICGELPPLGAKIPDLCENRKKPVWKWEYQIEDEDTQGFDATMGLPSLLANECAVLSGKRKNNSLRCNVSLANHRVNSALSQSYSFSVENLNENKFTETPSTQLHFIEVAQIDEKEMCDTTRMESLSLSDQTTPQEKSERSTTIATTDLSTSIPPIRESEELVVLDNGLHVKEGTLLRIIYPNEYPGCYEEDCIPIYRRETLSKCLSKVVELSKEGYLDLSPMNIGQFAYRLFWGIALISGGKIESAVEELVPMNSNKRFKRKSPWNYEISKSIEENRKQKRLRGEAYRERVIQLEEIRQRNLELRFEEMKKYFDEDTQIKRGKRLEWEKNEVDGVCHKNRHPPFPDCDTKSLIEAVIDESTGLFKRPLSSLTELQRRTIYQACIRLNLNAPIKLTLIPNKGRGVVAADVIHKHDFILEYRGELITEKEARERDSKYDRSRTNKGSFMFYFKHNSRNFVLDATDENASLGPARLINHSKNHPNLIAKTTMVGDVARLFFCASRTISEHEELLVDYGVRDPTVILKHPWLSD
ncbi:histone lysine methyltransferase SET8 [Cardiosporidium cionae]|uniref:Histone lysine methyltransferase SET8 n=1 Tax=Cardiosporidium cionae TaxID=476202 RepID=A0ABQ7J4P1_9APIC|nr:histone lysine methyltransferase SET8 [Cardiosporidium cionae]|eukprot:KAF8818136.1 histone lysine methyltransferase SET8 [Cardiosporidium cionae]